ncbi:type II and III secretion system protein family protein [Bdellovibrio svalbardensis]|uniref:Pilus assembly protein N-terminal domain-containing protein n=1 Tax=Bdellovibrio svalbardensis TaxID=2972972 RepID=A0ABT6DF37_9BACT|nr:pilus assembly protein N-terminal domain-containing protein [Bdellovibrio svalbardensis]MDG0815452.1 pilus assembly protein N-terminal domain-containing protein [Bdellovibrio svalbardensis]
MKSFLLIFLIPAFSQLASAKDLTLSLGETQSLALPKGAPRIWIQDGQIIQAEGAGGRVLLKARKEGMTTLRIGSEIYKAQVLHPDKRDIYKTLKESLQKIVGLTPALAEGNLFVSGRLYRFADWLRLAETIRETTVFYQMRAQMSSSLQKETQSYFNDLFEKAKIPPQTIIFEPAPEVRIVGSEITYKKYQQLLRPFGIQIIRDEQSLDIAPTIKVQITVAEVSREFMVKHGISWPSQYKATLLASGGTLFSDLELALQAMETRGQAKILASPNLICRSGKEAEFLAGGEFPIKVMNYEVHDILWKRFGILLKVKPKADASGRMSISIETEISRVEYALKVDDVPGIMTNRVSSHFDLTGTQTIALSGLLKSEDSRGSQGLPGLSSVPVIGALFGSKEFKENRTELVIFVKPSILKEGEEGPSNEHIGDL